METVLCDGHNKPCILKTGTKEGPNYGKHFYICSAREDKCKFVQKDKTIAPLDCPIHPGQMVYLQAHYYSNSTQEKRHYYQCAQAKSEKLNWCGHKVLEKNVKQPTPLKDVNRQDSSPADAKTGLPSGQPTKNKPSDSDSKRGSRASSDTDSLGRGADKVRDKSVDDKSHEAASSVDNLNLALGCQKEEKQKQRSAESRNSPVTSEGQTNVEKSKGMSTGNEKPPSTIKEDCGLIRKLTEDERVNRDRGNGPTLKPKLPGSAEYRNSSLIMISSGESSEEDDPFESVHSAARHKQISDLSRNRLEAGSRVIEQGELNLQPLHVPSRVNKVGAKTGSVESQDHSTRAPTVIKIIKDPVARAAPSGVHSERESAARPSTLIKIIKDTTGGDTEPSTVISLVDDLAEVRVSKPETKGVTDAERDAARMLHSHRCSQANLVRQLDHKKHLMNTVNVGTLPDKGARLQSQIDDLTKEISLLNIRIQQGQAAKVKLLQSGESSTGTGHGAGLTGKPHQTVMTGSGQYVQKTVSGQVVVPGIKQTKITDHAMSAPLSAHVYQQMYAANPQAMTLYGGRMTKSRLQQVGEVTAEALEKLHRQLESCPSKETEESDPRGLNLPLMTHQRQALSWLKWREQQEPPGGILADDMGLGKTLTMISLVLMQRKESKSKQEKKEWMSRAKQLKKLGKSIIQSDATLVVCPASLVHQWDKEIERRCTESLLNVVLYHGTNREKDILKLAAADVVLTTYNIISKEVGVPEEMKNNKSAQEMPVTDKEADEEDTLQPGLLRVAWARVILDEAHNIKNHKSLTAMSVCRLRALYRWALTGTPIQNDLLDMYSLLRFLRCSPFDELKVWKRQVDNKSTKGTQRLNTLITSLLLRRTKDQTGAHGKPLVKLPKKTCHTHELELSPEEKLIYDKVYQESKANLVDYLERQEMKKDGHQSGSVNPWAKDNLYARPETYRPGFVSASQVGQSGAAMATGHPPSRPEGRRQTGGGQILLSLLRMRQCCSHLCLMKDAMETKEALQDDGLELDLVEQMMTLGLQNEAEVKEPTVKNDVSIFEPSKTSTKIAAILRLLLKQKENSTKDKPRKSVIVSQWTKMLNVVEQHLKKAGFRCCTIRGDVPPKKRMELVDAFNTDPKSFQVMLLSLRAGGVGLNLIGGSSLFVIDIHWNPALEEQACDRIYRMGQERDVEIHRFICKDTVEEKIVQLQQKKLSLARNVLTGDGAIANKLTLADLRMLFGLDVERQAPGVRPTQFAAIGN